MPLADYVSKIRDVCPGCRRDTAAGALMNQSGQCDGCGATYSLCHQSRTYSLYVRCFAEVGYEQHLGDTLRWLGSALCSDKRNGTGELIGFLRSCDCINLFSRWHYWLPDMDSKYFLPVYTHCVLTSWRSFGPLGVSLVVPSCLHARPLRCERVEWFCDPNVLTLRFWRIVQK